MPFNLDKCKVMHIGKRNDAVNYYLNNHKLKTTNLEKDLGVYVTSDLIFSRQCVEVEKKSEQNTRIHKKTHSK